MFLKMLFLLRILKRILEKKIILLINVYSKMLLQLLKWVVTKIIIRLINVYSKMLKFLKRILEKIS